MCGNGTGQLLLQNYVLGAAREVPTRDVLTSWRPEALPRTSGCDSSDCAYCCALARLRRPGASPPARPTGCWLRRKRSRTELAGLADATPCSSCGGGDEDGEVYGEQDRSPSAFPRVPSTGTLAVAAGMSAPGSSMWDHALLVDDSEEERVWQWGQQGSSGWAEAYSSGGGEASFGSTSPDGQLAAGSSGAGGSRSAEGWGWHPRWQAPARLHELSAFLPPAPHRARRTAGTDIVCALEFEEHGWLLASAGVSKQVRVYSLASRLQHPESEAYLQPIRCHRMPSKLSSLAWDPDAPGAVTLADYDGVVAQVDMESGHLIAEADEHCGRRVWSVSHSLQRPHLCASASDDGTVRLWGGPALQVCLAALRPGGAGAPACCVQLSPFDGNLAAVASADHCAYVYDLRRADQPLLQLAGHARAVSYVRWLGAGRLVTASTDASLALWQLPGSQQPGVEAAAAAAAGATPGVAAAAAEAVTAAAAPGAATTQLSQPWKRLRGHRNSKNFCGLSVRPEDGLVACGSESAAVFAYHESWAAPLAVCRFGAAPGDDLGAEAAERGCQQHAQHAQQQQQQEQQEEQQGTICSAVAWQPATARLGRAPLLAAALSSGELRVMELRRPAAEAVARRCADG